MHFTIPHRRYALIMGALFIIIWVLLAIHPNDRQDWGAGKSGWRLLPWWCWRRRLETCPCRRISYTLILVFLCLHEVGAIIRMPRSHMIAGVPRFSGGHGIPSWAGSETISIGLVHFCYGLLLAYPIREVFYRVADVRGFWGYFFHSMSPCRLLCFVELC